MKTNREVEIIGTILESLVLVSELQKMEQDAKEVVEKLNNPTEISFGEMLGFMTQAMALGEVAEKKIKRLEECKEIMQAYAKEMDAKKDRVLSEKVCVDSLNTIDEIVPADFESDVKLKDTTEVIYKIRKERKGNQVVCVILSMNNEVLGRGVATCHADDKFDDKIGARIAEYRAREDWNRKSCERFMKSMNI